MKRTKFIYRFWFLFGGVLAFLYAFPFIMVLVNAFKSRREVVNDPLGLPQEFSWENFVEAAERMEFWQALGNSVIVTALSLDALILTSSTLAYYLARSKSKSAGAIFLILVTSMIVPFQALMIPFVGLYGTLNMLNSRFWLMFFYVGFGVAMSTFLFHGFIKNIPVELDEAAAIDGASAWTTFWKVVFPMLGPVTATVAIINGLWIWNDFLLPSLVLHEELRTLPLRTYVFFGKYTSDYGLAMAGLAMSFVPIILFYFAMQKQ